MIQPLKAIILAISLLFPNNLILPERTGAYSQEVSGSYAERIATSPSQNGSMDFGDGRDGDLLVQSGQSVTTDRVKSSITGDNPAGSSEIRVASTGGFNQGDEVLIITMQHLGESNPELNLTGQYETHRIREIGDSTLFLDSPLSHTYSDSKGTHQVIRVPQYRDVFVEGGLTCNAWGGRVGGVIFFRASGSVVVKAGAITAQGNGYRGGRRGDDSLGQPNGTQGESIAGGLRISSARFVGAGGGGINTGGCCNGSGGGGGYGGSGSSGNEGCSGRGGGGRGGIRYGQQELNKLIMGSGGGGGADEQNPCFLSGLGGNGGRGGGIVVVCAYSIVVNRGGSIRCDGSFGEAGTGQGSGGGGGAGGSIFLMCRSLSNSGAVSASGGGSFGGDAFGGFGGIGRVRIDGGTLTGSGNIFPEPYIGGKGQIVINEIMQNPNVVGDTNGEWVELFNAGTLPVDINHWIIKDAGTDSHVINNEGPLIVEPGGFLVLGRNADQSSNGGVPVGYQYDNFFLSNAADSIFLLAPDSTEIDRVSYDGGPQFPDPDGASMELIDPLADNNNGSKWVQATTLFGSGDLGTPGAPNSVTKAEIVLNATMIDFGNVVIGQSPVARIMVTNNGTRTLEVGDVAVLPEEIASAFTITLSNSRVLIRQTEIITITFAPMSPGVIAGRLAIESNDPDLPMAEVSLVAISLMPGAPVIAVSPQSFDFGEVTVGNSKSLNVRVFNFGTLNLEIDEATVEGTGFSTPGLEGRVEPGQSRTVSITFTPPQGGVFTGVLTIESNDPNGAVEVPLTGSGMDDVSSPAVTVISPNAGDMITAGSTFTIRWSSSDNVKVTSHDIRLSTDGGASFPAIIASNLPGIDQSFNWGIPSTLTTTQAVIRVIAKDIAGNIGQGDSGVFTVRDATPPSVMVRRPSGGEVINGGSQFEINWTSADNIGVALHDVFLSTDGGMTFPTMIAANLPGNDQAFNWDVPTNVSTTQARIRVRALDAAGNAGTGETGNFTIRDIIAPSVLLVVPVGGEVLPQGSQFTIRWDSSDNIRVTSHDLLLSTDGGASFLAIVTGLAGDQQTFDWIVANNISTSQARIRVVAYDEARNSGQATSENFTIQDTTPPSVMITRPMAGEVVNAGSKYLIQWSSSDNIGVASHNILLSTDGGMTFPTTIVMNLLGSEQSFEWNVSPSLSTTQAVIRVIARDASGNVGTGNSGVFTVQQAP